ncbi:hypothetical protein L7F22_061809 [Adiantum nelumboides]|nr:hypothetical protein [Adiantum nelumboides]
MNMGMAPIPTYASTIKTPFTGPNPMPRQGYTVETSTEMFYTSSKHHDPLYKFCFGIEDIGKDQDGQQVSPDFPQNGIDDPLHSTNSGKAQTEYEGAKVNPKCVTIPAIELEYCAVRKEITQDGLVDGSFRFIIEEDDDGKACTQEERWQVENVKVIGIKRCSSTIMDGVEDESGPTKRQCQDLEEPMEARDLKESDEHGR